MPLQIIKGDIVSMDTDAIVYADTPQPFTLFSFNPLMVHKTGKEILRTRDALKPLLIGKAKITPASLLDCKYIIHTSPPVWHGGRYHELKQLNDCYKHVFKLAVEHNCKSIAMNIIATDKLGYQKSLTQQTAIENIRDFLNEHPDCTIYLLLPGNTSYMLPGSQFPNVNMHLTQNYVEAVTADMSAVQDHEDTITEAGQTANGQINEKAHTFAQTLQQWMEIKDITEKDLCFKSNLSPETVNEILHGSTMLPNKNTAIALGMALELTLEELKAFLASIDYSLSANSKFDLIIEYCVSNGMYDLFDVNPILFRFEQELLG